MKSIQVGKFWGIPIKVHWTFSLLYLLLLGYGILSGIESRVLLSLGLFILIMFGCVILHEYGHALAARRFGVKTLDIIISPIGGIARLQKLPEKPKHELFVAIAGPLVNLSIALFLFAIAYITYQNDFLPSPDESLGIISSPFGFLTLLIWINLVLFVFNLVPAFPMDGGRILRALLAMKYGRLKATKLASIVGRVLAVVFVAIGLFGNVMLIFIGVFVFVMAKTENEQIIIKSKLSNAYAKDIMKVNFTKLHLSDTLEEVYQNYIRGGDKNYVVFDSMGNVSGVLPELFIKDAFKSNSLSKTVNEYLSNTMYYASEDITLDKLFEGMNINGASIAIIKNGDQILGVVDRQMLQNFIQLALSK